MGGGEENNADLSGYYIAIIKAKICNLRHLYVLTICYLGFGNDESKTSTECCDKAATYLDSNFKG